MNEAEARAELIDPQLEASGWKTGGEVRVFREFNISAGKINLSGKPSKASRADYVLAYKNVKLAVIEAKSDEQTVGEGVAQAKRDAQKLRLPLALLLMAKKSIKYRTNTTKKNWSNASPRQKNYGNSALRPPMNGRVSSTLSPLKISTVKNKHAIIKKSPPTVPLRR